jgi:transcriptional regulator with XRE-family HTH domain
MTDKIKDNPYLDLETDVGEDLRKLIPDTPEMRRVGKQEWLRLVLTDAMREARKRAGMSQKDVAEALGVSQGWVSRLESANYDHQVESVISHLDAVGAELLMAIRATDDLIQVETHEEDVLVNVPASYQNEALEAGMTLREFVCSRVAASSRDRGRVAERAGS